jgi:hypothetical protein
VFAKHGLVNRWGQPASVATDYSDHGVDLIRANTDRQAGSVRLLELLHIEPDRIAPPWASVPENVNGVGRGLARVSKRLAVPMLNVLLPPWQSTRHASSPRGSRSFSSALLAAARCSRRSSML